MNKNTFKWGKHRPWITIGLLSLQLTGDFPLFENALTPVAAAFTPNVGAGDTVSNEIIVGGTQNIYGGTANGCQIYNLGYQYLRVNSTANDTIIHERGYQWAVGSQVNNTLINGNMAVQEIEQGSRATNTTIENNGVQIVKNNATSNSTTISSYGRQDIQNSSFAYDTTINATGSQTVTNSTAHMTLIYTGGQQSVDLNSTAMNTTINGGRQTVTNNSEAIFTEINTNGVQQLKDTSLALHTEINGTGIQNLSDNAAATDTKIDEMGIQNLYNNATANDTKIDGTGIQNLYNNATANETTINNEGLQYLRDGSKANGTIINGALGWQKVSDTSIANSTIINGGLQEIHNSGIANMTKIYNNGFQNILSGTANETEIYSGTQWVEGVANLTTIYDDGIQMLTGQGIANDTTITRGLQEVHDLAIANDTTITEGLQNVYDSAITNDTKVYANGTQSLHGGTSNNTILYGGLQEVQQTSIANDTVINSQGEQEVKNGGTANNTVINSVGTQWIESGGLANITEINDGGVQFISLQGTAQYSTVNEGGLQSLQGGTANHTLLNGGIQDIQQTSIANNTTINNGGYQEIHSLGTANDTIINNDGNQAIYSDGTANYSTAYTGGSITVMENGAKLTGTTTLDGGALRLHPASNDGSAFITAQVQNLAGNGSIYLNTNLEALTGDKVQISGSTTGSHQIFVNNQGGASVDPNATLTIIETAGGGAFDLGRQTEVGGYLYRLRGEAGNPNNWELYSTNKPTSSGNASISAFTGSYLLNYAETQTLLQRMGDLRQGENRTGAWARVFGGKFDSKGDHFLNGFDMTYSGIQVGADKKIALQNGKGSVYVGGMFGYSKGDLDYGAGSGSIDSKTLGAYGTYVAPTGFFTDLVLKYGWMKNDFKVLDTAGTWVTGNDMNTSGLSASLEVGQRIHFDHQKKEGWYLEPQAQLSVGHQGGGSFNASNGLRVNVDSYNSTLGRLGVNVGYEMKSGKNPINVYAKTSYVHEFDGDVGYRMNGISEQTSFGGSWWTYGVGVTAQINKNHNVYLDIERASGGKFTQPWSINGGYRFQW